MVFSSTVFLFLFFPVVLLIYYSRWLKSITLKNYFLLFASLGFYAWGEPVFVFLMLVSTFITWIAGILLDRNREKAKLILSIAVAYHVVILFIFKYLGFVAQQVGLLIFHREVYLGIELPIGISFFTFQMMSYLFDLYYKKAKVQKNVARLALYVSLFPQLIAGPIVRYSQVELEIATRTVTREDFTEGMERFIYGMAKKVLLSNYLAYTADLLFQAGERTIASAWLGALCYTLQIYFDFSGYSDMAIGLGRLMGFHFSENFNYPYISRSVTEFWRRWHISLGSWFRDYVYIPLGGNRVSKRKWICNLFVVWTLTGIWHGANWTFLVWGLLYFVVLLAEKTLNFTDKMGKLSHVYTLLIVVAGWVIFRSDSLSDAFVYLGNLLGVGVTGIVDAHFFELFQNGAFVIVLGIVLSTPIYKKVLDEIHKISMKAELTIRSVVCLVLFALSAILTVASTYSPFIYFNF